MKTILEFIKNDKVISDVQIPVYDFGKSVGIYAVINGEDMFNAIAKYHECLRDTSDHDRYTYLKECAKKNVDIAIQPTDNLIEDYDIRWFSIDAESKKYLNASLETAKYITDISINDVTNDVWIKNGWN